MRTFTIIWVGQLASTIGSYMTSFALTLWAWELTGSATALALVSFFSQLTRIPTTLIAGIIVDRFDRKYLMILADAIAALSTITIGILYLMDSLQIWHIYLATSVNGGFGQIQRLAHQASISLMVPQQHYTRANSMNSAVHYGSAIFGPALAGILYPLIGLMGIFLIDLATFGVAIATLLITSIPQPSMQQVNELESLVFNLTFGFRTVWQQPGLRSLLLINTLFLFFHDLGGAVYDPMILARTNGSARVLASIGAAAGIGGVTGAIALSVWGGPKRRINGLLAGFIGAGLSKMVVGLGRSPFIWLPAQFCSSLNFPLIGSSKNAIWMEKIAPEEQGRVFAANSLVLQVVSAVARLIAGPLADRHFEPAMTAKDAFIILLNPAFGSGPGAGMAVLYTLCALSMLLIGIGGFLIRSLRSIETSL